MDIFDRIQLIVDKQDGKDLATFARVVGVKYETLRGMLKYRRSKPGYEVLKKIIENINWLNPDWLMTGRGVAEKEQVIYPENKTIRTNNEDVVVYQRKEDRLLTIIESQQRTIENLSKKDQKKFAGSA